MANTATARPVIPVQPSSGLQGFVGATPVVCAFDTLTTPLTVYTPSADNYAAIWAMLYEEADAHNLAIASGSTSVTLQRSANSGVGLPVGTGGFLFVGEKGQAITIACTTAVVATMLLYVVEFPRLSIVNTR